ncbi:MAG TPA: thioredoxin family protein, partial [Arenibacter sp.]|nr:thioredoxin family protein [Arenibacter sp.]
MENRIVAPTIGQIIKESLEKSMDYGAYRELMGKLAAEGKSTGAVQNREMGDYTLLNEQRMKRLDKTIGIDAVAASRIKEFDKKTTWLVLTESWCGDAAQTLPVINKMAQLNDKITLRLVLRDENIELMEQFLSNGTMAIPKLIAIDDTNGELIGEWGSRPTLATRMVQDQKDRYGELTPEFKQDLQ